MPREPKLQPGPFSVGREGPVVALQPGDVASRDDYSIVWADEAEGKAAEEK